MTIYTGDPLIDVPLFTPPRLQPLGIDVVMLAGGGYGPAQFFGKMADDRDVYCHYRGGRLSVHIAPNPDESAFAGETVLNALIGPHLHGGLSIGQLCRYAGITINGVTPPDPTGAEIYENSLLDLSGETAFLDFSVRNCSKASAIGFYNAIVSGSLGVMGFDAVHGNWCDLKLCERGELATGWFMRLAHRFGPDRAPGSWPVETANIDGVGSFPIFGLIRHRAFLANDMMPRWHTYTRRPNRPVVFLGEEGGFEVDDLWLRLGVPTDGESGRELAGHIHRIFMNRFPPTIPTAYNIETGERVHDKDWSDPYPLDPAVASWVAAAEDRWLWGVELGGSFIGYRPRK